MKLTRASSLSRHWRYTKKCSSDLECPTLHTYSALISALEKGKQLEQALEIYKEMQQHPVVPNVITYNALISALEKGMQPEQALEIFKEKQQHSIVPNEIAYNALISALEMGKQLEQALETFNNLSSVLPKKSKKFVSGRAQHQGTRLSGGLNQSPA